MRKERPFLQLFDLGMFWAVGEVLYPYLRNKLPKAVRTITDYRMTRYFMTIPEASRLVIQAGALMQGGEVFVLDMGEPVKILDLAKKMITLSGHSEDEIEIVETGIRPGEKLYEELLSKAERVDEQIYEKIFVGNVHALCQKEVNCFIDSLSQLRDAELKETLINFAQQ